MKKNANTEISSPTKKSKKVSIPLWFLTRKRSCEVRVAIVSPEYDMIGGGRYARKHRLVRLRDGAMDVHM